YSVVSMSFGNGFTSTDYFSQIYPHVTFVASTGDSGSVNGQAEFPADSPEVLAVGGTSLWGGVTGTLLGYTSETAWSGTGGGISNHFAQPTYQQNLPNPPSTTKRMAPDVSFLGDPFTGVNIYDSFNGQSGIGLNWYVIGGTSLSAPCWAGLIAITDQMR